MAYKLRHLVIVLALSFGGLVLAQHGSVDAEPDGCPPPLDPHTEGPRAGGDGHEHHRYVGVDDDRNGSGTICVAHVGIDEGVHVHTDDNDASR